ncbi:MAG TPA: hypothetical protein PK459_00420 [Anaerolineaceae bacterium]|nr:hypothetical protein [Anaerolineaceae bacterium]HQC63546.1 hypothetical protein [Anaerolineaceae bacterium]
MNHTNSTLKKGILTLLKARSNVRQARLPAEIDFSISQRTLKLFVQNPAQNMQRDSAAFEAWVLILKHWLWDEIDYVELDFQERKDLLCKLGTAEAGHYHRFMYRVLCMTRYFSSWFKVDDSKTDYMVAFEQWMKIQNMVLNVSLVERQSRRDKKATERSIESWFVFHEGKFLITSKWAIDENKLFNQLPVGVFVDEVKKNNAFFSGGAGAIDIWGIGTDKKTLHLIELKKANNVGLGVITEALFYTFLLYDTLIAEKSLFKFPKVSPDKMKTDTQTLQNEADRLENISVHILAERFHPLFQTSVTKFICKSLLPWGINFDMLKYSYAERVLID